MIDLDTILKTRVVIQLGLTKNRSYTLNDALDQAIWIYGDYGLNARIASPLRSPTKRLKSENKVKIPIGRAYRIMNKRNVKLLLPGFRQHIVDDKLIKTIPSNGIQRQELATKLDMSVRKLNYRLRKEQNNWTIVKHDDKIYQIEDFVNDIEQPNTTKDQILTVLDRYPYCTVDQLELLTGRSRNQLAGPISELATQDRIIRGLTRIEAPDEIFALPNQQLLDNIEIPTIVLEKRDALVEMIKLERYFEHRDADYWLFVDGVPQAEFDLDRDKRNSRYTVKNLQRFITTSLELPDILDNIVEWGKNQYLSVITDQIDDERTATIKKLTSLLLERGYQFKDNKLILDRQQKTITEKDLDDQVKPHDQSEILEWNLLGPWCKNRQFLEYDGSPVELLYYLGPLSDIKSIAYRINKSPDKLDLSGIVYIPGINHRMEFIPKDQVEDIIRGWPKRIKFSYFDKKILGTLQTAKSTSEIITELNESPMKIKQRLRYLEQSRAVRKKISGSLDINQCLWIPFDEGLDDYSKPIGGKRAMASVGTFFMKALENNPPLTKSQLSKYLGLSNKELEPMLKHYLRKNSIIEGYFIDETSKIQYTIPDVLDTLTPTREDLDQAAVNRVDILPLSDPFAMMHLPPLVMDDPSIQPTERLSELAEQWMIIWDGQPVGYMIKQPTDQQLLDYELDLKITQSMITTPIIAGALQKIVSLFRTWYGDEGKIKTINNVLASDDKWKDIHFLIESIGVAMD